MATFPKTTPGVGELKTTPFELETSEFDVFSTPPVDTVYEKSNEHIYGPLNSLSQTADSTITFMLPAFSEDFIDLSSLRVFGEARFRQVQDDGSLVAVPEDVDFSICNNFPNSIYSKMEVSLNQVEVMNSTNMTYPYKAFLEDYFSHRKCSRESDLVAGMWADDQVANAETNVTTAAASGFNVRKALVAKGETFYYSHRLHCDLFSLKKLLVPNVAIKIDLTRAPESFFVIAADAQDKKLKLEIISLKVHLKTIKASTALERISSIALKNNMRYSFIESNVTFSAIPKGIKTATIPSVLSGILPTLCFVGFLDNEATSKISKNPFVFKNHDVESLQFFVNGRAQPSFPFKSQFAKGDFLRPFYGFTDSLSLFSPMDSFEFTPDMYKNMYCFWSLPLAACGVDCNNQHTHLHSSFERGIISVEVQFRTIPTAPLQLVCFSTRRRTLQFDALRNPSIIDA